MPLLYPELSASVAVPLWTPLALLFRSASGAA
jgi:hypothetical protein